MNQPYSPYAQRFTNGGLQLRAAVDSLPPGTYRRLSNLISGSEENSLQVRYGTSKVNASPLADLGIHSLGSLAGGFLTGVSYTIQPGGAIRLGGICEIVIGRPPTGIIVGDTVEVTGSIDSSFNGSFVVTAITL